MEKPNLAVCLPGLMFSNSFVANWTSLYLHLLMKANVTVLHGYSNNIYVTRAKMVDDLMKHVEQTGREFDYVLWMDDDNILSPNQLDSLAQDLIDYPDFDGAMGWYWLQPHGYQIQPLVSCGELQTEPLACKPFDYEHMSKGSTLSVIEYGGMGAWLVRWEALKKLGPKGFAPILSDEVDYGFAGDDVSWFIRAKDKGMRFLVDKRVKVPHLKIRDVEFSPEFLAKELAA